MKRLVAIGEALIDFAPRQAGQPIKKVAEFLPNVGGAPANVCGAYVKLGGEATMLTQLGKDPFGDKIIDELASEGIEVSHIIRTDEANTSLAFVALKENGDREFSFYRKPGADMLYRAEDVPENVFKDAYALHFCSVSLGDYPMKQAHERAIQYAKEARALVSFDPNLRKQLWESEEKLKRAVRSFLPKADIVKLSEEEVGFVTGKGKTDEALEELFGMGIALVILTLGSQGACAYTCNAHAEVTSANMNAVDTTGAGDGFIGSFLNQLSRDEKTLCDISKLTNEELFKYLTFSNLFCSESVKKKGAITSYPTWEDMIHICK